LRLYNSSRLYNLDVDVWQPRILKLRLFFLDMQRQQSPLVGGGRPNGIDG
jgi:hypothetical protein